jgi:hypothetical protein
MGEVFAPMARLAARPLTRMCDRTLCEILICHGQLCLINNIPQTQDSDDLAFFLEDYVMDRCDLKPDGGK